MLARWFLRLGFVAVFSTIALAAGAQLSSRIDPLTAEAKRLVLLPFVEVQQFYPLPGGGWFLEYFTRSSNTGDTRYTSIDHWFIRIHAFDNRALAENYCREQVRAERAIEQSSQYQPLRDLPGFSCGMLWQSPRETTPSGKDIVEGAHRRTFMAHVSAGNFAAYISQGLAVEGDIQPFERVLASFRAAAGEGTAAPQAAAGRPPARRPPPSPDQPRDLPAGDTWTSQEQAAAAALAASLAALGLTGLAALLLRIRAGLPRQQLLADLLAALRGRVPDPFAAWKDKYTKLGWRYEQANGVARFVPVAGSHDEQGRVFDPVQGAFVAPAAPPPVDGQVDPATGKVWFANERGWVSREYYEQEVARTGRYAGQQAAERAAAAAADRAASRAAGAETGRMAQAIAAGQAALNARAQAQAATDASVLAKLRAAYAAEGRSPDQLDRLSGGGHSNELAGLYEDHLRKVIDANVAEAASQARWADAMAVGEYTARATVAAAKAGLVAIGGPAGYGAVMLGSGAIRAAEEGAEAFVRGKDARHVVEGLASGFVFGAKDGWVGRYVNVPGVGAGMRVLVPAAGDAGEILLRTGDGSRALRAGLLSAVGGELGGALGSTMRPGLALDAGHVALGGVLGGAGQAMEGGDAAQGLLDGMVNGFGSVAGGRVASAHVPMTAQDIQMDIDSEVAMAKGHALIEDFAQARTPQEKAEAVNRLLENHEAKLLMKNEDNYPTLKDAFAEATREHRTGPLLEGTSDGLNRTYGVLTTDANGQPVVRDIAPSDFQSGSSSSGQPGMDLDLFTDAKIVDRTSMKPARPQDVSRAVEEAARGLGIDPHGQEINVIDRFHAEALNKPAGESLKDFLGRPGDYAPSEAQSVSEVTAFKLSHGEGLPGGPGVSLSEACRTGFKDYNRFTRPMLDSHPDAALPEFLRRVDGASGRSGLDIIKAVGDGTLSPGTGNAQFRALTGRDLGSGVEVLAQLPESIAKLGRAGSGQGADLSVTYVINDGRAIAQAAVREALRSALGGGEP